MVVEAVQVVEVDNVCEGCVDGEGGEDGEGDVNEVCVDGVCEAVEEEDTDPGILRLVVSKGFVELQFLLRKDSV